MKRQLRAIYTLMVMFGFDLLRTVNSVRGLPFYFNDFRTLRQQQKCAVKLFPFGSLYPCLDDRFAESGTAKGHYFHQDLLVARRIFLNHPEVHIDVGSRVDGFVGHVAAFRSIRVIDIRPISSKIPNIEFIRADLMEAVRTELIACCDSLSCLHALEHFGLGRYGDRVQSDGYLIGLSNLCRLLKQNGKFYFSVPMGPQRIEFNAHRVFSLEYLLDLFSGKYHIDCFSYVDDSGDLHENVTLTDDAVESNCGCTYGCGIFEMTKL